jgi:hypothetical protein
MDPEDFLDKAAHFRNINRKDPSTYTQKEFPQQVPEDQLPDQKCTYCRKAFIDKEQP